MAFGSSGSLPFESAFMCLLVFAWQTEAETPLLLAANRDEFHRRPTAGAGFWDDRPGILGGRDLEAGGTWLGVHTSARFAAITNVRDPHGGEARASRSRGELTANFLSGDLDPMRYLEGVAKRTADYLRFNLLVSDGDTLGYLHGDGAADSAPQALAPGLYGLSNAALDVPWPKVALAKARLRTALSAGCGTLGAAELRACLADRAPAAAAALAGHGLEGVMARRLSAQFIVTEDYGTRCTTTLVWRGARMELTEQRYDAAGELSGGDEFALDIA